LIILETSARFRAKHTFLKKAFENKKMLKNKVAILIFIVAAAVRIFYVFSVSYAPLENDAKEYDTLGIFLSQGKGYINVSGEPTAYRPPIYPLFLGAIYFIAGHNLLWVRLFQAFMGAAICVLAYLIAIKIFNEKIATLSGVLCCLYPPLVFDVSQIMTETLFSFLLMLGIWLLISRRGSVNLFLSGFVFSLALLTRPFLVFFLPFVCYWLILRYKNGAPKKMAILIAGILIALLPWTIRNYYRLGTFVPFANVGGLTLYNSYVVPQKGFGFNSLKSIDDEYFEIGNETLRNKYLIRKSIEYVKYNPAKVIQLTAVKMLLFIYPFDGHWYPLSLGSKYNIFWGVILCFSMLGIIIHLDDRDINKKLIIFLFISFVIGIIVFYGSPRFRLPIDPLLICFAAGGFVHFTKKYSYASSLIMVFNVMLFFIFRHFQLQELFHYFKNLI
jgi:4-amino-4-deoxy-L-arabinose transferase-like glycosyltransferase